MSPPPIVLPAGPALYLFRAFTAPGVGPLQLRVGGVALGDPVVPWPGLLYDPQVAGQTFAFDIYDAGVEAPWVIWQRYDSGPPDNSDGAYQDLDELASMTEEAWLIRWRPPGSDPGADPCAWLYMWELPAPPVTAGWTVGHIGVFPPAPT